MQDDETIEISDPSIPQLVRDFGAQFKDPARYVCDLGEGEYILYAEDGEVLDYVYLK